MIEVEVRIDHPADVVRGMTQLAERVFQLGPTILAGILDAIDVDELGVFLVADSGVDQHQAGVVLDQQAPQGERDAIALVGRSAARPERFRDDTEHRPAVEMLETGFEGVACEATDFESGVGQFTKSVNVVAPFPWANRSSLARHLAAATASPVARCLPSISMPK